MATLTAPDSFGTTLTATVPDGSFIASSFNACPAGYTYTYAAFNPPPGSKSRGVNKGICIPAPAPAPAPSVPTSINVSPNITTTVSPQISPVFQQQDQPVNSPATASTAQVSAEPAISSPPPATIPAVASSTVIPQVAPTSAPPPINYAPQASVPSAYYPPTESAAPVAASSAPVTEASPFDWKIAAIFGAVGIIGLMALNQRGR